MKILATTGNYGTKNLKFLNQVITEIKSWPCEVDIVIHTDIHTGIDGVKEVIPNCNPIDILGTTWNTILENRGKYDLYLFFEDDHLITWNNIQSWLDCQKTIGLPYIVGFFEYEEYEHGKWFQSHHMYYDFDRSTVEKIGDYVLCQHTNLHQGCYLLNNELLDYIISHPHPNPWKGGNHPTVYGPNIEQHYGPLERVNTDIFRTPGLKKVIPISHFDNFLVHHLPHIHIYGMGIPENRMRNILNDILKK